MSSTMAKLRHRLRKLLPFSKDRLPHRSPGAEQEGYPLPPSLGLCWIGRLVDFRYVLGGIVHCLSSYSRPSPKSGLRHSKAVGLRLTQAVQKRG